MLVAGVSGGKKLIESAKLNKTIRQIQQIRLAINQYILQYDTLLGDFNDDGFIGNEVLKANTLPSPYNFATDIVSGDNIRIVPFLELYLKGLYPIFIDPSFVIGYVWDLTFPAKWEVFFDKVSNKNIIMGFYPHTFSGRNKNSLMIWTYGTFSKKMVADVIARLDTKIDDGNSETGLLVVNGSSCTYETPTNCDDGWIAIDN